ncbi:MAG: aminofutalosine synthase MqnE [Thermoguttaceae bacterium]|nr:aminofutalosine synthase MqnE [Thermoguttaceae bacterium]MDW8079231.1 aminofutalosine synthase MqnE [Thermoguttaceae bacterium]
MAGAPSFVDEIDGKISRRNRLSAEDALRLFDPSVDLHQLGKWADEVRRQYWGLATFYAVNAHINPTNICQYRCPICAYHRPAGDPEAWLLSVDEVLAQAAEADAAGCTELHIVGGLPPDKPYGWYRQILQVVHEAFPRLGLKAWSAVEIAHFAKIAGRSIAWVLEDLRSVGLVSLPGGGAEIFAPAIRKQIAPAKADAETWLEVHRTAHRLGIPSNATILYGHVETPADRVDHLLRLRALQDETGGFQALVPLPFHPPGTQFAHLRRVSPLEDLRMIAVSRLVLDNFPHIKAYWVSLTVPIAQLALEYGADDLDGTVRQEKIFHQAGSRSPQAVTVTELRRLIQEVGQVPVERDALYRRVIRDDAGWQSAEPVSAIYQQA